MQLLLERPDYRYFLRGADGGSALVNERRLTASFILAPDTLIDTWSPHPPALLDADDLAPLLALAPELILLGTGSRQIFPPLPTLSTCLQRGIGIEVMTNAAAARTYTVLAGEGRRVVAGFLFDPDTRSGG